MYKHGYNYVQEVKNSLSALGQKDIDDSVIHELLESLGANYNLEEAIKLITGRMDFTDSGFHDIMDKAGPSNIRNDSIIIASDKSTPQIDISSDSDDDDNYYNSDMDILSPRTSSPTLNSQTCDASPQDNEQPIITLDDPEILEENNNDPNNNLDFTEIVEEQAIISNEPAEIQVQQNADTPIPGCSKDVDILDISEQNNLELQLHKEAKWISAVLPDVEFVTIYKALKRNKYAINRTELALWDLLPEKRPIPQKRKTADDCTVKPKKLYSKLDSVSNEKVHNNEKFTNITYNLHDISSKEVECLPVREMDNIKTSNKMSNDIHSKQNICPIEKDNSSVIEISTSQTCFEKVNSSQIPKKEDARDNEAIEASSVSKNNSSYSLNGILRPPKLITLHNSIPLSISSSSRSRNILVPPKLTFLNKGTVDSKSPISTCEDTIQLNNDQLTVNIRQDKLEMNNLTNNNLDSFEKTQLKKNVPNTKSCKTLDTANDVKSKSIILNTKNNENISMDKKQNIINLESSGNNDQICHNVSISKEPEINKDYEFMPSTSKKDYNYVSPGVSSTSSSTAALIAKASVSNSEIAHLRILEHEDEVKMEIDKDELNFTPQCDSLPSEVLKYYYKVLPIFPHINSSYIQSVCLAKTKEHVNLNETLLLHEIIEQLLASGDAHSTTQQKKVAEETFDLDEQYENLLGIFPDADPTYLRNIAQSIYNAPEKMKEFVQSTLEKRNYPTKEQYLKKQQITEQQKQYTTEFKVEKFLEIFPDPFSYFENENRKCQFSTIGYEFLKNRYNKIKIKTILQIYKECNYNLSITTQKLKSVKHDTVGRRSFSYSMEIEDIPLLQEIAFIIHRLDIEEYWNKLKEEECKEFCRLKENNELLECQCCYDNQCMPSKCSTCNEGHIFCNECIRKGTESKLSEGVTHISCFSNCTSEFSLSVLQRALPPTQFSIFLQKRQQAEVIAAGLEGLVLCPFCHFASIPPPEDKVFKCFNPECMKETCRLCEKVNHLPLTCKEADGEKAQHYLEEQLTEALVHNCYKCSRRFIKEEGCNRLVCICGAIMCYICDKPVTGYDHFSAQGSTRTDLCPLWSDNRRINAQAVLTAAKEVTKRIKQTNPNIELNVESILPKLPPKSRGPHEDIQNANVIPERAYRIARMAP